MEPICERIPTPLPLVAEVAEPKAIENLSLQERTALWEAGQGLCVRCGRIKPRTEFKPDWHRVCRACYNIQQRAEYKQDSAAREEAIRKCKEYDKAHREERKIRQRAYDKTRDPLKKRAVRFAQRKIREGKIIRPNTCPRCGSTSRRIEAHHKDYSKPLEVEFLCSRCHKEMHLRSAPF
jgi:ribosomal protein S27AE